MYHFNIVFGLQNGGVTRADKSRDLDRGYKSVLLR